MTTLVGFDPGSRATGYGVLSVSDCAFRAVEFGSLRPEPGVTMPEKLEQIYADAESVLNQYKPGEVVVEKAFYHRNAAVTLILGQVRGVLILAARRCGAHVIEMTPKEIKRRVTGNGAAKKEAVRAMLCRHLKLKTGPSSLDASDALAMALAHGLKISRG